MRPVRDPAERERERPARVRGRRSSHTRAVAQETVELASALPVSVTVDEAWRLPLAGEVIAGVAGAAVSTRTLRAADGAETPPGPVAVAA